MDALQVRRLGPGDEGAVRETFAMMAQALDDAGRGVLGPPYLRRLLAGDGFWALAAFSGPLVVGGLTAHLLPMTRAESTELFIYDLAVHASHRRRGVGSRLVAALCTAAVEAGVADIFVPADNGDTEALDFYRALGGTAAPVTHFTFRPGPFTPPTPATPPPRHD